MSTPTPPGPGGSPRCRRRRWEPALPIVDLHHRLWPRADNDYKFPRPAGRTRTGYDTAATALVDCQSVYRKEGPAELRCVGKTEFANGVAAMSASGICGGWRASAGRLSLPRSRPQTASCCRDVVCPRGVRAQSRYLHLARQSWARLPHWPLLPVRCRQACSSSVHLLRQVAWAQASGTAMVVAPPFGLPCR